MPYGLAGVHTLEKWRNFQAAIEDSTAGAARTFVNKNKQTKAGKPLSPDKQLDTTSTRELQEKEVERMRGGARVRRRTARHQFKTIEGFLGHKRQQMQQAPTVFPPVGAAALLDDHIRDACNFATRRSSSERSSNLGSHRKIQGSGSDPFKDGCRDITPTSRAVTNVRNDEETPAIVWSKFAKEFSPVARQIGKINPGWHHVCTSQTRHRRPESGVFADRRRLDSPPSGTAE